MLKLTFFLVFSQVVYTDQFQAQWFPVEAPRNALKFDGRLHAIVRQVGGDPSRPTLPTVVRQAGRFGVQAMPFTLDNLLLVAGISGLGLLVVLLIASTNELD